MFCTRFIFAIVSFFALAFSVLAAPVVSERAQEAQLEKRTTHTDGRATWYNPGLGNCGWTNTDNDLVVAISIDRYNDNNGSNCGQYMHITNSANGKSVWAKTVDSCQSCGYDSIDLSPTAFKKLASLSVGVVSPLSWHFEAKGFKPPST